MLAARAGLVPGLPLMHPAFYIRPARVEEAAALSDLCFRSKAVWGYDPPCSTEHYLQTARIQISTLSIGT